MGIDHEEASRYFGIGEGPDQTGSTPVQQQEKIWHNYLLEKKSVNELTTEFTKVLTAQLAEESHSCCVTVVDPRNRPMYSHIDRDTYVLMGPSHTFRGLKSLNVTCISVDLGVTLVDYLIVYYFYYFYLSSRLSLLSSFLLFLLLFLLITIKSLSLLAIHRFLKLCRCRLTSRFS